MCLSPGGPSSFQTAPGGAFAGLADPALFGSINQQLGFANQIGSNPYAQQAQDASNLFASQASPWAQQLFGYASSDFPAMANFGGLDVGALRGARQAGAQGQGVASNIFGQIPSLTGASGSVLNTAFDPQQALYDRTAQQVLSQQNAINAMSGVAASPYGAGVTGNTMSNFNIDWQNQQLQRQLAGLQGAGQGFGNALNLGQGATNLMAGAAALPANTQSALWNQILGRMGQLYNLGGTGLSGAQSAGAAPYNTSVGQLQNSLQSLQSPIQNLNAYLQMAQNAANLNNQAAQMGFQDQMQAFGGIGNLLGLGGQGLFGSNGMFPGALGSLFGGGGGGVAGGLSPLTMLSDPFAFLGG